MSAWVTVITRCEGDINWQMKPHGVISSHTPFLGVVP